MRRVAEPVRAQVEGGYRIGRWGRLALTLLTTVALALLVGRAIAGSATPEVGNVMVRPGDTLWSIATSAAPDRDPRAVIDDIRALNDVRGDVVQVGEVLRVPVSSG